ncbi:MAG: Glyoxylate/hydroxypyruvate reductase B [Alphaproteobacteria bacterium MarineAlpha11_Bin1]|nr:MAG: Glyoxylate/hydroxypyruvate reductase B [Alphaproteobacteria bacterium MarineAlpha11_Bin1]
MRKLAILDDYQNVAMEMADWTPLDGDIEITVFNDHLSDEFEVAARLIDYEVVMVMRERTPFPRSLIEKLPKLEHIVSSGMRNLSIDVDAATENGVVCTGTPSLGYPTAELTWGLIHALARNVPQEDQATRAGAWQETVGIGLRDKALGIMGLGRIGMDVARVGIAMGMRVIAWSENLTQDRCDEAGAVLVSKEELLGQADFLTIHLLLSDRTRGLIQGADLARMKSSSYLINTSRGPIVEEAALISALENNTIAGAGLDVFDVEPLPNNHPLRNMRNTVIIPHLGYVTVENYRNWYVGTVENLRSWLDGKIINEMSGRNPIIPG